MEGRPRAVQVAHRRAGTADQEAGQSLAETKRRQWWQCNKQQMCGKAVRHVFCSLPRERASR